MEPIILENNGELFYQTLNNQNYIRNYEYKFRKSRKFHIHLNNGIVFFVHLFEIWFDLGLGCVILHLSSNVHSTCCTGVQYYDVVGKC